MTLPIVGFAGLKGAGKDTAGAVFIARDYLRISFAYPLKQMLHSLLLMRGCPSAELERYTDGDLKEQPTPYLLGNTPRHAMQTLGTEWGRNAIRDELWLDTWKRFVADVGEPYKGVVVTDVRFQNEVDAIKAMGGRVFRIVREPWPTREDLHASERGVMDLHVDAEIQNLGDDVARFQKHIELVFFAGRK